MTKKTMMRFLSSIIFVLFATSGTAFATSYGIQPGTEPAWWYDPGVIYYDGEPNAFNATQLYNLDNAADTKVFVAFYYTRTLPESGGPSLRFESGFEWTGAGSNYSYNGNWDDTLFTFNNQEYGYVWRSVEIAGDPGDLSVIMTNLPDYPYSVISEFHIGILQTPVPIPGAVWLLGSGLIGLTGFRRWFNK